jgi:threonine dehydratase
MRSWSDGIICASGGNHGLGVALASSRLEIPCQVILPIKTPQIKIDAITKLGATVILHGDD